MPSPALRSALEWRARVTRTRADVAFFRSEIVRSAASRLPERVDDALRTRVFGQPAVWQGLGRERSRAARAGLSRVAARNAVRIARSDLALPSECPLLGGDELLNAVGEALRPLFVPAAEEVSAFLQSLGFAVGASGTSREDSVGPGELFSVASLRAQVDDLADALKAHAQRSTVTRPGRVRGGTRDH